MKADELRPLEALIRDLLQELGYPIEGPTSSLPESILPTLWRVLYMAYFDSKFWVKKHTGLDSLFLRPTEGHSA